MSRVPALRLEYGGEITVTTVYPGYIRTSIHAESQAAGARPRHHAPRRGRLPLLRHLPRRLLDAAVRRRLPNVTLPAS